MQTYERVVRGEVIPGIEARNIPGFRHIDLMKRHLGNEVEFMTLMWFDGMAAIKAFIGEDYSISHVPSAAQAMLSQLRRPRSALRGPRPPRTING